MELSLDEIVTDILERGRELMLQTAAAVVVGAVIIVLGRLARPLLQKYLSRRGRPSRTRVFTALYRISVAMVAVLLALTLAFPSVRVADVLASLGILSVAVGFAFKNVLENLLAGVLLLLRDPFKSGDQIKVGDAEGTVEGVTVRETLLRTYDGQLVLIPNAQVYTSPLEVRTHYPYTRVSFALAFPAETDLRSLSPRLLDILLSLTPDAAPKPEFLITAVRDGAVEVELRLWSLALRSYTTRAVHDAIAAVMDGLNELGVAVDEPAIVVREEATRHAASRSQAPQDKDDARP